MNECMIIICMIRRTAYGPRIASCVLGMQSASGVLVAEML